MDFLSEQQVIYTSKKYENIYFTLSNLISVKYYELFILCASIGFKNNRKGNVEEKGREFKSNFFNREQKATAYTIILNDEEIGKNITDFENKSFIIDARRCLESYAEGGMEILIENVFKSRWTGTLLDENYDEYDIDIMSYIYQQSLQIPF